MADEVDGVEELRGGFDLSDAEIAEAPRRWHAVREIAEAT